MSDISNRTLALLLVTAIVVSLGGSLVALQRLDMRSFPTGRATPDFGNVSVEVESAISIRLTSAIVDFGAGYVNTSTAKSPDCQNNATLTASGTYTDLNDCWTSLTVTPPTPTGLVIENDGNVNVSLTVTGPTRAAFFTLGGTAYSGSNPYNISWKARDLGGGELNACAVNPTTAWTGFDGTAQNVCDNFHWDGNDAFGVDIQVIVPSDLPSGVYRNSTIQFDAVAS